MHYLVKMLFWAPAVGFGHHWSCFCLSSSPLEVNWSVLKYGNCLLEPNRRLVIIMELPLSWPGPACSPGKHSLRD